jgi:hypothetical protein
VGIWLAMGFFSLASCAPLTLPGSSSSNNPGGAQVGSSASPAGPETHFNSNAPVDSKQSQALTDYLHRSNLPLVGARVLSSNGASHQVILYGYVRTPFGKADAADHAREFLKDSGAQVDNRLKIEPELAGNPPNSNPNDSAGVAGNGSNLDNSDVQQYQQREQTAQQQQYLSQGAGPMGSSMGSSGLMMILPLLLGGSSFGGGGMGFGMGGGGFGSPYGGAGGFGSPYGGGGYPPPGYGNPYGP